jgi:hypothetical protein
LRNFFGSDFQDIRAIAKFFGSDFQDIRAIANFFGSDFGFKNLVMEMKT